LSTICCIEPRFAGRLLDRELQEALLFAAGGTGKAEGEGPNDHPGRRIGGVGIGIGGGPALGTQGRTGGVGGGRSRDEPRRHTLSGDHQPGVLLHHQQFNAVVGAAPGQPIHPLHPRHLPPPHNQYGPSARHTTMDLEVTGHTSPFHHFTISPFHHFTIALPHILSIVILQFWPHSLYDLYYLSSLLINL
jgi:hypothetical protein